VPLLSINGNIFKNIVLIITNPVVSDDGYLSNGTISVEGNPFAETAVASEGTPIAYFDQATMSLIFPTFNVSGFNSVFMQTLELNGSLFYPAEYNKRPASTSQNWRDFLKKIKPGDILLLGEQQGCNSNPDACFFTATEKGVLWNGTLTWELSYGYLSHAAIVASVSDDGTLLKVFNARNQGEGVGTDWLDEQFIRNKYKVINVVRANGAYDGAAVVSNAISKYSSFFYDPFPFSILAIPYKVKEKNHDTSNSTFCADLVGRAFADFGIDVRDQQKYDSGGAFFQIRDLTGASVLAVKSTLFTPDALSLSGNISPVTSLLY
ncbi:MAG: hypothetical protein ACXVBK_15965, partial [Flavisolibacter sp.]